MAASSTSAARRFLQQFAINCLGIFQYCRNSKISHGGDKGCAANFGSIAMLANDIPIGASTGCAASFDSLAMLANVSQLYICSIYYIISLHSLRYTSYRTISYWNVVLSIEHRTLIMAR